MRIFAPPAARSRLTIFERFALTVFILSLMQGTGSAAGMQGVTSLPLIEIVTRPTLPLCFLRKSTAVSVCVLPG